MVYLHANKGCVKQVSTGTETNLNPPVGSVGDQGTKPLKILQIQAQTSMVQPFKNDKTETVCI